MKHVYTSVTDRRTLVESVTNLAGTKAAKDIARSLGITHTTLKGIAQANGISLRYEPVNVHDQFLIRELKSRYDLPYREIAGKFELSIYCVRRVCLANCAAA